MSSAFLAPSVIKRISKELRHLTSESPEGIKVIVNEEDIGDVQAWVLGPDGTPYENGCFRIKVVLGADFPSAPPKCFFITKIFHPNVSKTGEVCVNTLKKDWKQEHGIGHILLTVKCLLIYPNPESALNEEAGKLLLEAYDDYARHARLMTSIHAQVGRAELPPKRIDLAHEVSEKDVFKERRPVVARKTAKDPTTSSAVGYNAEAHSGSVISGKILSSSNSNVVHVGSATMSSTNSKKVNLARVIIESDAPKKMEGAKRKAKEAGGGVGKEVSERKRALKRL